MQIYGDVLDWYANWVKDFAIMGWGFTFRDAAHLQKFTESAVYQKLADELRAKQRHPHPRRVGDTAAHHVRQQADPKLEDIAGIKMRVPEIKVYVKLWETLGARPSRLAWAEVFLGLKNGVVDAAEGPVSAAFAGKFHEAVEACHPHRPHLFVDAHHHQREGLPGARPRAADRSSSTAAQEAVAWARDQAAKDTDDVLAKMAAAGATVHKIDVTAIQARSEAAVADMEKDGAWSAGLWKAIQEIK